MNNFWKRLIAQLQKHLSECPYGEVSLSFIVHSGSIEKIIINHTERYMDITEVPDVSNE